jgi:acetolactate synthase-1/2/3 large subunit
MQKKVSDYIADFLEQKEIRHVFGIIGAGNAHIFDSIQSKGYTEIICVHHEQAACMAMQTYYRVSGRVTAALLTTGGGSTNGVTGVVSAWADSIPGLIISGNEHSRYIDLHKDVRMLGVQGYDSSLMVEKVTKQATRILKGEDIMAMLEEAYALTTHDRPGPCWVDVPMNVQAEIVDQERLVKKNEAITSKTITDEELDAKVTKVLEMLGKSQRPLFWLGNGIRLAGANTLLPELFEKLKVPGLVSWAGIDMIDSTHPLIYGRAGTYGQRCANFVLQNCDLLICVGTRLAISQIGYDITELARGAEIAMVDIDVNEINKLSERIKYKINADAKKFISKTIEAVNRNPVKSFTDWIAQCDEYRRKYPWVNEKDHPDIDGFINSYEFMNRLNNHLKKDQVITTDMGTALLCGHQVLKIKNGQRLMTSTGLGEMGYGLPAALGASFARNKGEVMCLNCDGGMMMNLQEIQTMVHHQLPIKLIIFNNDGYLMIKHTQNALFKGRPTSVDQKSGVSCPDFSALAAAFKIPAFQIRTWEDFDTVIPQVQEYNGPVICEVFMHPKQLFVPKLSLAIQNDGSLISPPLEDLFPFIDREELKKDMLIGVHEKSLKIQTNL